MERRTNPVMRRSAGAGLLAAGAGSGRARGRTGPSHHRRGPRGRKPAGAGRRAGRGGLHPSVAADTQNIRRKAEFLEAALERRGFAAELLETDGNPLVFGERAAPDAERTLLIYFHYDGQPVDPARWQQDDPFAPILRDGRLADGAGRLDLGASEVFRPDDRIYARSVADDTAPIIAFLGALDALDAAAR